VLPSRWPRLLHSSPCWRQRPNVTLQSSVGLAFGEIRLAPGRVWGWVNPLMQLLIDPSDLDLPSNDVCDSVFLIFDAYHHHSSMYSTLIALYRDTAHTGPPDIDFRRHAAHPPQYDQFTTATASTNTMTDLVGVHCLRQDGTASICTIPCELQLDILFYLLSPTIERLFHPHREMTPEDQNALRLAFENHGAAITQVVEPYLEACRPARASWDANRAGLLRRLAGSIRQQIAPLRKALQRQRARARARFVLWRILVTRDGRTSFRARKHKACLSFRDALIRWNVEQDREDFLGKLASGLY
jgi:hypothetical protein